jgi:predicted nucleotidyltransferase
MTTSNANDHLTGLNISAPINTPLTRGGTLLAQKTAARLERGLATWKNLKEISENRGWKVVLFGSMAKGNPHVGSDIDILVLSHEKDERGTVLRTLERAAGGERLDIVFREDVSDEVMDIFFEDMEIAS